MGRRIGDREEEAGHVIAFISVKAVAISDGVAREGHRRVHGAIDHMAHGVVGAGAVDIGRSVTVGIGTVGSSVGVAGNAIPVKGGGVTKATEGHGGAGLDLLFTSDDGSVENPEELVGVTVRMAAGTGKGLGRGGVCVVEGDASALEGGRGGVVERDGGF